MKILIVGAGGREHALAWKISQSPHLEKLFCAPGNGGTATIAENVPIKDSDIQGLSDFALKERIDLTVVGPELPLTLGIVDRFESQGLRIFGPNKKAAELEGKQDFRQAIHGPSQNPDRPVPGRRVDGESQADTRQW